MRVILRAHVSILGVHAALAKHLGLRLLGPLLASLLHLSFLSLDVVLGQVAVLTLAIGVVRLVGVDAIGGKLGLALPVVAVVAHVLGIVLFVAVSAHEYLRGASQVRDAVQEGHSLQAGNDPVLRVELLLPEVALLKRANCGTFVFNLKQLVDLLLYLVS